MNPTLTPVQARVIAALVEKSISTPDYYPLTTNSLMAACNQKSQRQPHLQLSEGEVGGALRDFEVMNWVKRDDSARATKWRQQFQHQMLLKREVQAVLVTLMLRGPQTAAELRGNAAYIGGPEDAAGVQAALDDLADRAEPLVTELPRQPGQAATRWAHRLCGEPEVPATVSAPAMPRAERNELEARVAALEARLAALEAQLGV
ncbi:YceH family protein [Flagellatimonas centrodinii]|mgnify:CR=1 FL=1|uniref:DUF480 domain-containing protein n=1 Tax=Flagellatimonas centrodinii TaxID=2806210 RepID=UPI001FED5BE1|nr:DUF480 domain-containing protein [Flagellatimonas centrodinii]ULQ47984.1 YceH family protein [Flagellatimonas centrodinii]